MFYKYLIPVSSAIFILGCSSMSDNQQQPAQVATQNNSQIKPGTIKIRTKSDNAEVELEFNVGTDNIVFVMDVSDDVSVIKDGKELVDDEGLLEEDLMVDMEQAEENLDLLDKPVEELDIAELSGLQEKPSDRSQDVNEVTSNIVKSQTLFYEREYLKSLSAINRALKESPNNAVANAIKGSIYYQLGDKKQANIYWKTALKLDPSLDSVRNGIKSLGLEGR